MPEKKAAPAVVHKKSLWKKLKPYWILYLMILPGAAYLIMNNYIPMGGIILAFKKYSVKKGIFGSDFVGLTNFSYLFSSKDAAIIIRNTFCYNVAFIIINNLVGIILALFICDIRNEKLKKFYQSTILLPFLISIVVVSYIVFAFLSHENGMFNAILSSMGKEEIMWYASPKYWPFILTFVNCWKGVGYGTLIYIACINGIDTTYYEAAALDGATKWQQIKFITLPFLIPSLITLLIMAIGKIFASDFGLFYQIPQNSGALFNVTQTIDTYVYRAMIASGGIGRSAAAGMLQSVVGFTLVMLSNWIVRKTSPDNAMF